MTPNDTADRRLATDCDWLSASVVFEDRESEIGEEDQQSINTHTTAVPPKQVNRVFRNEGDASLNENHWANQTHRRLLSHQIAVKYTPDKAISWRLSHWASERGQSLLKVRPWSTSTEAKTKAVTVKYCLIILFPTQGQQQKRIPSAATLTLFRSQLKKPNTFCQMKREQVMPFELLENLYRKCWVYWQQLSNKPQKC